MAGPASDRSMIPALHARLIARLSELHSEARSIRAAIMALEGESSRPSAARRFVPEDELGQQLLDALIESPGERGSMLALMTGLPSGRVVGCLTALEATGVVRRDGLGWVVSAVDSHG